MELEIIVESLLLKTMIGSARDEYKPILDLQENSLVKRFGTRSQAATESLDTLNQASLMFAGAYQAVKSKLSTEEIFTPAIPDEFKRVYSVYAASEAVVQSFNNKKQGSRQLSFGYKRPVSGLNIEFDVRDYNTIADALESLTKYILGSSNAAEVSKDVVNYFESLREYTIDKLNSPAMHMHKNIVEKLKIKGSYFEISGIKKSKKKPAKEDILGKSQGKEDELFEKDPTSITLEKKVQKKDVIANKDALDAVESAIQHLLAYDSVKKTNPYLYDGGFCQFILLVGDSGTGKTMVFKYGISEAQRIAKANNLDFRAVSLDFDDAYQDGPVKVLRHQLKSIVNDNRPYLIFLDEMEAKFSARRSQKTARYEEKTIREFLDFSNGLGYPNRGNYIVLGASNLPNNIDKAIRSRFSKGTYLCEGPKTAEEKARILYNNLLEGINKGYVSISDWKKIGRAAESLKLGGRELAECSRELIGRSRTNSFPENFYNLNFEDKLKEIQSRHKKVNDNNLIRQLYSMGEKRKMVQRAAAQFSSG